LYLLKNKYYDNKIKIFFSKVTELFLQTISSKGYQIVGQQIKKMLPSQVYIFNLMSDGN